MSNPFPALEIAVRRPILIDFLEIGHLICVLMNPHKFLSMMIDLPDLTKYVMKNFTKMDETLYNELYATATEGGLIKNTNTRIRVLLTFAQKIWNDEIFRRDPIRFVIKWQSERQQNYIYPDDACYDIIRTYAFNQDIPHRSIDDKNSYISLLQILYKNEDTIDAMIEYAYTLWSEPYRPNRIEEYPKNLVLAEFESYHKRTKKDYDYTLILFISVITISCLFQLCLKMI